MATYTVGYGPRYVRRLEGRCLRLRSLVGAAVPVRFEGNDQGSHRMSGGSGSRELTTALLFIALQFLILAVAAGLIVAGPALPGPLG